MDVKHIVAMLGAVGLSALMLQPAYAPTCLCCE